MNALRNFFGRQADVALVALVVGVLMVLFVPIPRALLDFLILANFAGALLLLLLTFYMERPVQFSTFPSLLLLATLFRLSLNVAATRLILAEADAGRVIAAIGSYVVGGNSVVGFVVFLVLVVVQYVVVTNGAQRVSEVAARWVVTVERWRTRHASLRQRADGRIAPSAADELMLYQMLVGAWPLRLEPGDDEGMERFASRIAAWQRKALREAKRWTRWTSPNEPYEDACEDFLRSLGLSHG